MNGFGATSLFLLPSFLAFLSSLKLSPSCIFFYFFFIVIVITSINIIHYYYIVIVMIKGIERWQHCGPLDREGRCNTSPQAVAHFRLHVDLRQFVPHLLSSSSFLFFLFSFRFFVLSFLFSHFVFRFFFFLLFFPFFAFRFFL